MRLSGSLLCLLAGMQLAGAEYFVGPDAQFKRIGDGVRALKPGDTLTVLPGEYFESVEAENIGSAEARTVIRAQKAGTVLLRGDRAAPQFSALPGSRFIYQASWDGPVNAVNERDSFKILLPAGSVQALEFLRGYFFHDAPGRKLYISTSDGEPPEKHFYTISVLRGSGLYLRNPVRVEVEGLMATGFYSHSRVTGRMSSGLYGIRLNHPRQCVIRNCTAFFNANGIHIGHGDGSLMENCTVYANGSYNPSSGGGLVVWGPAKNAVIRNCRSFFSAKPAGKIGIRIYGGRVENCRIENCISFGGEQAIGIKAENINSWCIGNYCETGLDTIRAKHNTVGGGNAFGGDSGMLRLDKIPAARWNRLFADPENHDFRPQADTGEDLSAGIPRSNAVRFLAPDGNDDSSGTSIDAPWRTLKRVKRGDTVYLLAGSYPGLTVDVPGVTLRARGLARKVLVRGDVTVSASGGRIEGVNFIGGEVKIDGDQVHIENCGFAVPLRINGERATVVHNAFLHTPQWRESTVQHSNLLPGTVPEPRYANAAAGDFTVTNAVCYRGRGFDALPIGPCRLTRPAGVKLVGPFVRSVTDTTANIEWWTDRDDISSELRWGESPECGNQIGDNFSGGFYHTATLTGLRPGKTYYFRVASHFPLREYHSDTELDQIDRKRKRIRVDSELLSCRTAAVPLPARELFVAVTGRDDNPGSAAAPFRTISAALAAARAGDTVTVGEGEYREMVRFRSGGAPGAPLILRSAPDADVVIEGFRTIPDGITLNNQSHIVIEGFRFHELNGTTGAAIRINGGSDIRISRCFSDGRSDDYTPGLVEARGVKKLTVENCVILRGFHGSNFWDCPDLVLRNNVWIFNQIIHFYVHNRPEEKVSVEHSIFVDNVPMKHTEALFIVWHLESLAMKDNAFFLRVPPEKRSLVHFIRNGGKLLHCKANEAMLKAAGAKIDGCRYLDPQFPVVPRLLRFRNPPELTQQRITRSMKYNPEALELQKLSPEVEFGRKGGRYPRWTIRDFISRDPVLVKNAIGIQLQ